MKTFQWYGMAAAVLMAVSPAGARELRHETANLRGFGKIVLRTGENRIGGKKLTHSVLTAESPEKAMITASKYLADLKAYGAVTTRKSAKGTLLEVRHGGLWLLGVNGKEVHVFSAPDETTLRKAVSMPLAAVKENAYPAFLDNFDNAGLGIWWMATKKSPEQLAWMKNFPAVPNLHDQRLDNTPAANVYDISGLDHSIRQARSMGKNYRHMIWTGPAAESWHGPYMTFGKESVDYKTPGYTGRRFFEAGGYGGTQAASDLVNAVQLSALEYVLKNRVNDPRIMAWMEPHGEFHLTDPVAYPPDCRTRFPEFLKNDKKFTLAQLNRRYGTSFRSWNEIPYTDTAFFWGRRGKFLDMDTTVWRWKSEEEESGLGKNYHQVSFDDSKWFRAKRESRHLLMFFKHPERVYPLWARGEVTIPAEFLKGNDKIYCYVMPYTEQKGRGVSLWFNGKEAGRNVFNPAWHINRMAAIEVTSLLKPGKNSFSIFSKGGRIGYRVFLSHAKPESYPFESAELNARYLDWRDYIIHEKLLTLKLFLQAIRTIDPNRPIKVMTPHLFQSDAMDLLAQYGGYPQLTGEGAFYRPMHYKGYSRLRGLPGSSEPGGAQKTAPNTQHMFAMILWEGQDVHDYVFDLNRELWQHKEALKWWTQNADLLRTIGKTDFIQPPVGMLRDVRQSERYQNTGIWNWDLSRGPLNALGFNPVLIDGGDLMKRYGFDTPVIFDCATQVMEENLVKALLDYVSRGGVFIAQHHTGRHSEFQSDNWPLASALGLKVTPKWLSKENYHRWPMARIRFEEKQDLFPALRGKTIRGSGVSIDYLGNQRTGGVAISGKAARPVARWEDGTMAIAEVPYGKGKFILLGSPFYIRMQDDAGKWSNDADRQKMLEMLLNSCGIRRDTVTDNSAVWVEHRYSKNGLYDVYMTGAMGLPGKTAPTTQVQAVPGAVRSAASPVIAPDRAGAPDVKAQFSNGKLTFGTQSYTPFQIRQFAVLREDAAFQGPAHWLGIQEKIWRPLAAGDPEIFRKAEKLTKAYAAASGEDGLDISGDWQISVDNGAWKPGRMGAWSVIGHDDAGQIVYRKTVRLPEAWRRAPGRMIIGMAGYWTLGLRGDAVLKINGKVWPEKPSGNFRLDISRYLKEPALQLELTVKGPKPGHFQVRGPAGTLYLRRTAVPKERIVLKDFEVVQHWATNDSVKTSLPFRGKALLLRTKVMIPAKYAGRVIRLTVDQHQNNNRSERISGLMINDVEYFRPEVFFPTGPRVDVFLKPGEVNTIELLGPQHIKGTPTNLGIKSAVLEVF